MNLNTATDRMKSEHTTSKYRRNVGIVLFNGNRQVLWARRVDHDGWQFPQGGIGPDETSLEAVYRELHEELGLDHSHVRLVGSTKDWLKYDIPLEYQRRGKRNKFRGQMQKWYLMQFIGSESDFCLDCSEQPEFDKWQWVDYWQPVETVVAFKRGVYKKALAELEQLL